jgi:hypothetical protein
VRLTHVHQPAVPQQGDTTLPVTEANRPQQHAGPHVQRLPVGENLCRRQAEPVASLNAEGERKPVWDVDQILIFNRVAGDLGLQPVIAARQVRSRVVNFVRIVFSGSSPRHKVSVPERA